MKKLLLSLLAITTLISCNVDDDGPNLITVPAKVVDIVVPEFFEQGKTYEVKVTYILPTSCHIPAGISAQRGGAAGDERRDIYIWGGATIEEGRQCNEKVETRNEEEVNPLEKEGKFTLLIDEDKPYTFYLWSGTDEEGKDVYSEVVVEVEGTQPPIEK